jgi:prepilin-type N-terminal cleavage/methylation domain-containing protein
MTLNVNNAGNIRLTATNEAPSQSDGRLCGSASFDLLLCGKRPHTPESLRAATLRRVTWQVKVATLKGSCRAGLTLVEMLTVVMIIGLLMTLTIGGFMRTRTVNKLLATEQAVSDAVRQARHTARSTGAPVFMKVSPIKRPDGSLAGGTISGIAQTWVWNEFFDHGQGPNTPGFTIGRSGTGRKINQSNPWFPPELERSMRFRPGDGAYISVAVRPPLAGSTHLAEKHIPLLLVGADSNTANSSFGIMLMRSDAVDPRNAEIQSGIDPVKGRVKAKNLAWEAVGWVRRPNDPNPIFVSSIENLPSDLIRDTNKLPSGNYDIADPIGGDHWEDIGLLVTPDQITLYRNGRRLGELRDRDLVDGRVVELPKELLAGDQIWVGQTTLSNGTKYANCPIDDVRVFKLGSSDFGTLPQGVYPMAEPSQPPNTEVEYRILAHPEGRVELSYAFIGGTNTVQSIGLNTSSALPTGTMYVGGDFTRQSPTDGSSRGANSAQITISIDGRVNGSLILVTGNSEKNTTDNTQTAEPSNDRP